MGLKADVDEVVQYWSGAPWRVRVLLAIALFLSSSSLASLSEAVWKWKGFILDALTFYRSWVVHPMSEVAQRVIGQSVPPNFIDNAIFFGLFMGALTRALLFRAASKSRHVANIAFMGATYLAMLYMLATQQSEAGESTIWVLYPIYVFTACFLTKGAERVLAVAYMLIPAFAVGVLAAISVGLSK